MGAYGPSFFGKSQRNPVQEILELVKQKYVDTVNTDSLGQFAIQDMLNQLDPHSIYIPPVELQMVNEEMAGNFQGVGIEFMMLNDTLHVLHVFQPFKAATISLIAKTISNRKLITMQL